MTNLNPRGFGDVLRLLRSNAAVCILLHGVGLLLRLVFLLALLRYTNSTMMGQYALAAAIEVVVVYVSGLEFHTFTARRYARTGTLQRLRLLIRCHQRLLAFTVPLAVLVTLCATEILDFQVGQWNLIPLLIIVATGVVTQEIGRYMMLTQRPVASIFLGFIRNSAWQPLAIFWLSSDPSALQMMFGLWAASASFSLLWGLWILRDFLTVRARPRTAYILAGIHKARGYYLIAVSSILQSNLERFILQLVLGLSAVGTFSFYQTLANTIPALVQSAVTNIATPNLLEQFGRQRSGRFEYLRQILLRTRVVVFVLSLVILGVASPLISFLNRPDYIATLWILPVLLVGQAFLATTQLVHLAIYASHHDRPLIVLTGASLTLSVVVNTLLINAWGLFGAVVTPVIIGVVIAVGRLTIFRRLMRRGQL